MNSKPLSNKDQQPKSGGDDIIVSGGVYAISVYGTDQYATLMNGDEIRLRPYRGGNDQLFKAVEDKWEYGLKNESNLKFFGINKDYTVECTANEIKEWESFAFHKQEDGGSYATVHSDGHTCVMAHQGGEDYLQGRWEYSNRVRLGVHRI